MNTIIVRVFMLLVVLTLASISVHVSRVAVLLEDLNQGTRELINAQFALVDTNNRLSEDIAGLGQQIREAGGKGVKDRSTKKGGTQ